MTATIRPVRSGDIIGMTRVILAARGFRGARLEQQIEIDLARFREMGIVGEVESDTLIAMEEGRMVGVMRYGEFDEDAHLTRPEIDPEADGEEVTTAFLRGFWAEMRPTTKRAMYIDYPEPSSSLPTLGSILEKNGFHKLLDRLDMRLELTQEIPADDAGGLMFSSYHESLHERFLQAYTNSFIDSLDPMMEWDAEHPRESFEMFRERFGTFDPNLWVLATDREGRDVGFALFQHFLGGRYHNDIVLLYMAVLPEARGHGYGEWIVREGLRRIRRSHGAKFPVSLTVSKPNTPAANIYKKLGFRPVESFSVYRMNRT